MDSLILKKSFAFSVRIVKLQEYLTRKKKEYVMSNQVLRSGTSVGANLHEAKYAQSTADFVSKNSIALKEISETLYWLELLYATEYLSQKEYSDVKEDALEILKILTSIVKSAKTTHLKLVEEED